MAEIVASVEISRRPHEVFSYVADPSHQPEWIQSVVSARQQGDGPLAVGSTVLVTRRVGPWTVRSTEQMTKLHPPRTWANRGVGGIPVVAFASGTVAPLDDGRRSRVTIACQFQGHGIGKLLVPLLARRLAKQLPRDQQKLKEVLERSAYAQT
jgi:uncharacterized protein YndB with AHSA1/START domain